MRTPALALACILVLGLYLHRIDAALAIDAWDKGSVSDDTPATGTELVHGSDSEHDLQKQGGPDVDWYRISQQPFASYEIVVDAVAGEIAPAILERVAADGTSVLQSSEPIGAGIGASRSLRWHNASASAVENEYIRVMSGGSCTEKCKKTAVYRIRAFESTYSAARFNNTGTQVTVLIVQNPQSYAITGTVYLWDAAGMSAGTSALNLAAKASLVLNTSVVAPAVSGSITIAHDGRYGDLSGKTIGLEPATGFSFDTALEPRPH